jgi:hypothetical protein
MSFFKLLFGSVITIIILLAWYVIPIMKPLPKPTGKYSVGFVSMAVTTQREEIFSPQSGEKRKLALNIWYPIAGNINGYTNDYIKRPYLGEKMPIAQQL